MGTQIDDIAQYLQGLKPQTTPLNQAMMARSLAVLGNSGGGPMIKPQDAVDPSLVPSVPSSGYFADAGQFGGPATLPTNPGPVDPPILTQGGNYPAPTYPTPGWNYTTHLDPNMGYLNPSIQVSGGGPNSSNNPSQLPTGSGGISFSPSGQLRGGTGGPQGSVYGIDPNTGNPVYNVTGSPRPGFFDSKTGKFVETLGSTGLNMWVPGLGFVTRAIFDAFRRNQARNNTGTDLSGSAPAGGVAGGAGIGGYQLPSGIQDAIARGDYQTAYGQSPMSAADEKTYESQAYGGNPNQMPVGDAGINRFGGAGFRQVDEEGGYSTLPGARQGILPGQLAGAPSVSTSGDSLAAYNNWIMTHSPRRNQPSGWGQPAASANPPYGPYPYGPNPAVPPRPLPFAPPLQIQRPGGG